MAHKPGGGGHKPQPMPQPPKPSPKEQRGNFDKSIKNEPNTVKDTLPPPPREKK